jgi:hypothetical protein
VDDGWVDDYFFLGFFSHCECLAVEKHLRISLPLCSLRFCYVLLCLGMDDDDDDGFDSSVFYRGSLSFVVVVGFSHVSAFAFPAVRPAGACFQKWGHESVMN